MKGTELRLELRALIDRVDAIRCDGVGHTASRTGEAITRTAERIEGPPLWRRVLRFVGSRD